MPLEMTVVAGVTDTSGGPFPPTYPVGASGYIAAGSNPTGDSAGSSTVTAYYGSTILAIANDAAGAAATQLLVAIAGSHDVDFLGPVTIAQGDPDWADVVLLLPFDGANGATATTDISPLANAVTITGALASLSTSAPQFGTAALSVGALDPIAVTGPCYVPFAKGGPLDIFKEAAWTIEFWVKSPAAGADQFFYAMNYGGGVSIGSNSSPGLIFYCGGNSDGTFSVSVEDNGLFGGQTLSGATGSGFASAWNHIALVNNGSVTNLYVNGVSIASTALWNAANYNNNMTVSSTSPNVVIGSFSGYSGSMRAGSVDEVRVTGGVARYTANFTPATSAFPDFAPPAPLPLSAANFIETTINENAVSVWIWQLAGTGVSGLAESNLVTFGDTGDVMVELQGESPNSDTIVLNWTNTNTALLTEYVIYRGTNSSLDNPVEYQILGPVNTFTDTGLTAGQEYSYYVSAGYSDGTYASSVLIQLSPPATPGLSDSFNCNCESVPLPADGWQIDSLANLRKRMLIRAGYAAQANNPPPGMILLCNEFLREAQNQLYRQHWENRTLRMYAWQMEINQRYYGFSNDESDCRRLDPLSVDWVGFEDLNQAWYPLIEGIDPVLYTRAQISTGWPTHYEIRSCIEIFPAPRAAYTLWIKGRFGLDPFVADTDNTTIDAESIFLLATGLLKMHYSQPDGQSMVTQALNYTKYLVSGRHGTRRYVPRTRVQTPMTPPRFLPMEE